MSRIILHTLEYVHILEHSQIIYCKSDNSYTEVFLGTGEKILVSRSLATVSKELTTGFVRVSQSYLVNTDWISIIDKKRKFIRLRNNETIRFTIPIKELSSMIAYEQPSN